MHVFLVYNENSDVICVNETWLNSTVSDQEILHSGFSIFVKDEVVAVYL